MEKSRTAILFGRSPFIKTIEGRIPELCRSYYSIGCNYFVDSYPDVRAVGYYDDIEPQINARHLVITRKEFSDIGICTWHERVDLYDIVNNCETFSTKQGVLHFHFHTPSMLLNWCYLKGFRNVLLAGIDLEQGTPHFDDYIVPKWTNEEVQMARHHLENVCTKYINLYQLNPNSTLAIQKVSIDSIL